jgi:hypothetical protein
MEEFELKKDIIFNSFENDKKLKMKILEFITEAKTDKILFKGNPIEINYKLLKKVLPEKENNKLDELDLDEENLRISFEKFIKKIKVKHCLIYKK